MIQMTTQEIENKIKELKTGIDNKAYIIVETSYIIDDNVSCCN